MFSKLLNSNSSYIIAEVGQNHQGDFELAKKYVNDFSRAGASAIKFQVRNNKKLFTKQKYNSIYNSNNAFAQTYGAHREFLELSDNELEILKQLCVECNVDFMATAFDEDSLDRLLRLDVDVLKIASFDLGNLKLLDKFARSGKPLVLSIGGGNLDHVRSSIDIILNRTDDLALLHCVSEYPCPVDRLGLSAIPELQKEFNGVTIGLSDHFSGTLSGPIGYNLGARVFEKHVTLNRAWKGTDHAFALESKGFSGFVRDIGRVPLMMRRKPKEELGKEFVFKKLGKSLCLDLHIKAREVLTLDHLGSIITNGEGTPVREAKSFLGKAVKIDLKVGDLLTELHLVNDDD